MSDHVEAAYDRMEQRLKAETARLAQVHARMEAAEASLKAVATKCQNYYDTLTRTQAECTRLLNIVRLYEASDKLVCHCEVNQELQTKLDIAVKRIYEAAMMCQISDPNRMRLAVLRELNGH